MNLKRLDWILNFGVLFLFGAGLLSLVSAAPRLAGWQLLWGAVGAAIVLFFANFDWRPFINYRWFIFGIYALSIVLLIITYFLAPPIRGIRAWLAIGSLKIQTSELAKFALILVYSHYFAKQHVGIARLRVIGISFLYFLLPAILVFLQPDIGSALILGGVWFGYLLISGIKWKHLFAGVLLGAVGLIVMWNFGLKDYQKERIVGLFNPENDPLGINYSVIQAKIAIGSAGFLGKGFGQGTQTQLGFLPEAQTDFIFAAFTEEWGLIGAAMVLAAFFLVLFQIMRIGLSADNNFFKLICLGAAIYFLLHFVVNVGSNVGLVPVIGVSFPFLSYGGSNLLVSAMLIGLIQSGVVYKRL